ncbi:hypothetical protein RF11_00255 [Thelohanellus kitauei]|uniref:Uncharacterized protein n=1 Tax=Thelohanellus kitauei TaxID=669202 RepID=A0A0C2IK18_THEKT|nr:hypothetical protein RF11_00255 [Thelohanellus kitauei]
MELGKSNSSELGYIKCNYNETTTEIEINECNVYFVKQSETRNFSIGHLYKLNKGINCQFTKYLINLTPNNSQVDTFKVTVHNLSIKFQDVNRTCEKPNPRNTNFTDISIQYNSDELIYPCKLNDTNGATESSTFVTSNPIVTTLTIQSSSAVKTSSVTIKITSTTTKTSSTTTKTSSTATVTAEISTESVTNVSSNNNETHFYNRGLKMPKSGVGPILIIMFLAILICLLIDAYIYRQKKSKDEQN